VNGSTLELYKKLIAERKKLALGSGQFRWAPEYSSVNTLAYLNNGILVISNFGPEMVTVPAGEVIVSKQRSLTAEGQLEANQSAWIKL
jgi:alpha-glucosidase